MIDTTAWLGLDWFLQCLWRWYNVNDDDADDDDNVDDEYDDDDDDISKGADLAWLDQLQHEPGDLRLLQHWV